MSSKTPPSRQKLDQMELSAKAPNALKVLRERIGTLRENEAEDSRVVIALAGIPGSGKSTIATALLDDLYQAGIEDVAVVPMVRESGCCGLPSRIPCAEKGISRMASIIRSPC